MELSQYSAACRLCLRYDTTFYEIFNNKAVEEKIRKVFKFTLRNSYQLSHLICLPCHENLNRFDEFADVVRKNQDFLNHLHEGHSHPEAVDVVTTVSGTNPWGIEHPAVDCEPKVQDDGRPASECDVPEGARGSGSQKVQKKYSPRSKGNDIIRKYLTLYCDVCGENSEHFENFAKLTKHFKKEHYTRGYAICCDRKFIRKDRLLDHITVHLNPNAYKCTECGHRSKSALLLEVHRKQHNKSDRRYVCDQCEQTFVTKSQLYNHTAKHGVKRHVCNTCGKAFGHKFLLTKHRLKHENSPKFICEICAKQLATLSSLNCHMKAHNQASDTKVQCHVCAKWFKNAETLRSHVNARHKDQRDHRCEPCNKVYPTGSALLEHVRMVHQKDAKHSCDQCDKRFFKKSILTEHIKRAHSGPTPKALFQCEFCEKEYLHSNNYFFHRKKAHPEEYARLRLEREQQQQQQLAVVNDAGDASKAQSSCAK
ncbi:zinc finger protein 2-like [Ochlerotatus camptorhynchus]|uniref:zinc finger protein 2-like n=1 Tax=Ochlerotatus camptorhynchus TaxID=644619 RepID=UPI0031CE1FA4